MRLHVKTLYVCDSRGRLVQVNEPGGAAAERFFLGRTPEGNVCAVRHDLPAALVEALEALARAEPVIAGGPEDPADPGEPRCAQAVREALHRHQPEVSVASPVQAWRGPAYLLPDSVEAGGVGEAGRRLAHGAQVVRVTDATAGVLQAHFDDLIGELPERQPCLAVIVEGRAVSVCFSSRNAPRAAEAGLETIPAYRGRGYAAAVTAAWARLVRAGGRLPLYSTAHDNTASRAVARRVGGRWYGEDFSLA